MLERPTLWLSNRLDARSLGLGLGTLRHIRDGPGGPVLGQVRESRRAWGAAWRTSTPLSVEEGTDGSLLCSVRRPPWWEGGIWVLDADEHPVARLHGTVLALLREGKCGTVHANPRSASGRAWIEGSLVANWRSEGEGVLLSLAPLATDRPFTAMALLGAALFLM